MPTNLPPQCGELEKEYLAAKTLQEKIIALQKYLSAIPKHKGTQRLRSRLKTKLSKLRMEAEIQKSGKTASSFRGKFAIKKEGAAQIIILGVTSSGKSSLLTALTNAKPKILNQPMTTTMPIPGMMVVDDVQIQLVEAPALFQRASEGVGWGSKVLSLVSLSIASRSTSLVPVRAATNLASRSKVLDFISLSTASKSTSLVLTILSIASKSTSLVLVILNIASRSKSLVLVNLNTASRSTSSVLVSLNIASKSTSSVLAILSMASKSTSSVFTNFNNASRSTVLDLVSLSTASKSVVRLVNLANIASKSKVLVLANLSTASRSKSSVLVNLNMASRSTS
ncbi:MAG: 50S ribosome-binding GTPase, partial [Candidatus Bathyarchaeota archaeon]